MSCLWTWVLLATDQSLHAFPSYQRFIHDVNQLLSEDCPSDTRARSVVVKLFHDLRLAANHKKGPADSAGGIVKACLKKGFTARGVL